MISLPSLTSWRYCRPRGEPGAQGVVVDERLALLVDERARLAGLRVHFDHAIDLMAALIVFEGEAAAVLPPDRRREGVRRSGTARDRSPFPSCWRRRTARDRRCRARRRACDSEMEVCFGCT